MFKQILNTFFVKVLAGILNLVIAIIISNYLGAEGKGIQGIILTTISILVIFSGIIGSGGLTYLLPRMSFVILIIPCYLWILIIVGIMSVILLTTNIVPEEYVLHILILTFISSVTAINRSILYTKKLIQKVNLINIIQIFITLAIISYLVVYKDLKTVNSYITALYFGFSISCILSYIFSWRYYVESSFTITIKRYLIAIRNLFKYGGYNQLDIFAQLLSFRLAYYVLNSFTSTALVGIYSNAVSLIEAIWIISRSISFVQHSRIINSRDQEYKGNLTLYFIKMTGTVAFFATIVLILIPSAFYEYLFGHEFGDVRTAIIALSPGVLFFSISFVISAYFSGTGKHSINTVSSITGLVVITVLTFLLIPKLGIVGAGIAASLSYLSTTIIKIYFFKKLTGTRLTSFIPTKDDYLNIKKIFRSSQEH